MPQDRKPAAGSFSDLYEAMQTRSTKPTIAPATAPQSGTPRNRGKGEPLDRVSAEPPKSATAEPRFGPNTLPADQSERSVEFSVAEKPYKAHGFLWTKEELWALKDIKDHCERRYDVEASLQDLIRCALHMLVEDYRSRGGESFVVRRMVKKQR